MRFRLAKCSTLSAYESRIDARVQQKRIVFGVCRQPSALRVVAVALSQLHASIRVDPYYKPTVTI